MTVDVSTKKQTAQPNVAIVVIVVLVVLWFVSGRQTPDPAPTPKTPNAMVIVPAVGQASSMLVDRWAKKMDLRSGDILKLQTCQLQNRICKNCLIRR